eukprot:scaffold144477_cov21-Tisochrysis_lutea.AAC.1
MLHLAVTTHCITKGKTLRQGSERAAEGPVMHMMCLEHAAPGMASMTVTATCFFEGKRRALQSCVKLKYKERKPGQGLAHTHGMW